MKGIAILLIILTLALAGCNTSNTGNKVQNNGRVEIYIIQNMGDYDFTKGNIDSIVLEEVPILTSKQMEAFDWKSQTIKVKDPDLGKRLTPYRKVIGTPFVVLASGERVYVGTFWTMLSSATPPEYMPCIGIDSAISEGINESGSNIGNADNMKSIELGISEPFNKKDVRFDERLYKALKADGILNETTKPENIKETTELQDSSKIVKRSIGAEVVKKLTIPEAEKLVREYIYKNNPDMNPDAKFPLVETTTEDIFNKINAQVYKVKSELHWSGQDYIIKGGIVNSLGSYWGGNGITDMKVADVNGDGKFELVYKYTTGSGISIYMEGVYYDVNSIQEKVIKRYPE